mgnify:CR=1 FL=1
MNDTLWAVYIGVLCLVALLAAIWLVIEVIVRKRKERLAGGIYELDGKLYKLVPYEQEEEAPQPEPAEDAAEEEAAESLPEPQAEQTPEPESEPAAAADPNAVVLPEDAVVLRVKNTLTYDEAYAELSGEEQRRVDDILAFAMSKDKATKRTQSKTAATVSLGRDQLVRIAIRKGVIVARITVPNDELSAYADAAKTKIKAKPIDIKVDAPETVGTVKDLIDLTYKGILDERERKKQLQRERRRAKQTAANDDKGGRK